MKVCLAILQEEHLPELARLANNAAIADVLTDRFPHPYLLKDAYEFWEMVRQEITPLTFAIESEKAFSGIISLEPQRDIYRFTAELGYWVGAPFWNQGIATHAISQICTYGFQTLEMKRIFARVFAHNTASARVLETNEFKKEGVIVNGAFKKQSHHDLLLYAKTASV